MATLFFPNNSLPQRGHSLFRFNRLGRRCAALARCEIKDDGFYIRRCVELARSAVGRTSPNPMVGCVIVNDRGDVVGEGFHPKAGQPHAEVFALRHAGALAENATAYVSLEPCNHFGRTPPCTEALIHAKVKRVVVGMTDPNPIVSTTGIKRLKEAGIQVLVGVEETLCHRLNEVYIHQIRTKTPFVTLRYTVLPTGGITSRLGKEAVQPGGYYSKLLQEYDGVILSSEFALSSELPVSHEKGAKQPAYIIAAKNVSSPLQIPSLQNDAATRVTVLTDRLSAVQSEAEVVVLENMNLSTIAKYCWDSCLCSVLVDYRGADGNSYNDILDGIRDRVIQKVVVEVLHADGASREVPSSIPGLEDFKLGNLKSRVCDDSVIFEGYLQ